MPTVYSERHRLQDGQAELLDGTLLPCSEKPARAELIITRVLESPWARCWRRPIIVSSFRSADGTASGSEHLTYRSPDRYEARGVSLAAGQVVSTWSTELARQRLSRALGRGGLEVPRAVGFGGGGLRAMPDSAGRMRPEAA